MVKHKGPPSRSMATPPSLRRGGLNARKSGPPRGHDHPLNPGSNAASGGGTLSSLGLLADPRRPGRRVGARPPLLPRLPRPPLFALPAVVASRPTREGPAAALLVGAPPPRPGAGDAGGRHTLLLQRGERRVAAALPARVVRAVGRLAGAGLVVAGRRL